jgi:glutamine synthetase
MRHHKAIAGLTAPNAAATLRLQPASLSGYWCNWGGDNRNVTAARQRGGRQEGPAGTPDGRRQRRTPTPRWRRSFRPALLGYEGKYDLQPKETGDGFTGNDAEHGVAASLTEAIDDLAADTALSAAVGQGLVDNHIFMKRAEVEKTAGWRARPCATGISGISEGRDESHLDPARRPRNHR